ncbi:MAG: AAA family ATPase [Wolbachia endosymbiont of Fragariocoptes setiger]|nr:AAA family ATPase [Wolbachia endosymbiont of Fragariocoptes setiger]
MVFIDEIDAIGRKRSDRTDCANDSEHVMAIEKFFSCMDELKHKKSFDKIVIIGATNRLDSLDEAFSRRFAQKIELDLPDLKSRKELLLMYSKELIVNLQESFDLEKATKMYIKIGEKTDGFSGADLENLCNSIKWNVCMDKKHITLQEIENCFNYEIERTNKQREDASPQQYLDINSIMGILPTIMGNSNIH